MVGGFAQDGRRQSLIRHRQPLQRRDKGGSQLVVAADGAYDEHVRQNKPAAVEAIGRRRPDALKLEEQPAMRRDELQPIAAKSLKELVRADAIDLVSYVAVDGVGDLKNEGLGALERRPRQMVVRQVREKLAKKERILGESLHRLDEARIEREPIRRAQRLLLVQPIRKARALRQRCRLSAALV